jgi:hypothetical protein
MPFLSEAMRNKTIFGNFSKFIYRRATATRESNTSNRRY